MLVLSLLSTFLANVSVAKEEAEMDVGDDENEDDDVNNYWASLI